MCLCNTNNRDQGVFLRLYEISGARARHPRLRTVLPNPPPPQKVICLRRNSPTQQPRAPRL